VDRGCEGGGWREKRVKREGGDGDNRRVGKKKGKKELWRGGRGE